MELGSASGPSPRLEPESTTLLGGFWSLSVRAHVQKSALYQVFWLPDNLRRLLALWDPRGDVSLLLTLSVLRTQPVS